MNLLKETLTDIENSGHEVSDIVYIGSSESAFCCVWSEYETLANIEYDEAYGSQKIASDLIIVFSDGQSMWRHEYDGSEWWMYSKPFKIPANKKKIITLCSGYSGQELDRMNAHD